jgi:glycosyltransferase involved in cell wall biosynthesis
MTRSESFVPLSVCIPVRNEERNLAACLTALRNNFDDIVVVDSGSTDATPVIAKEYGVRIVQFVWDGRYPKKRNWALRNVEFAHDWILFLDADEVITPAFIREVADALPVTRCVGFWLSFTNHFMGRELRYGDRFRKLALFRQSAGEYENFPEEFWTTLDMEVHEHPVLDGPVGQISAVLVHRNDCGLHHYIARHNDYSTWEANRFRWLAAADAKSWENLNDRQRFKYRNLDKWWLADLYFWTSFIAKGGFRDGITGWRFAAMKRRYFQDIRLKILEQRRDSA